MQTRQTAAVIIIGNEILSGRTQDTNLNYIATQLADIGIDFMEARVVPDIPEMIISAVNKLRIRYDYIFTTGGIGPTHDDITSESIARAFSVPLIKHPEIVKKLEEYYNNSDKELNSARLRMANVPEGAVLIENSITSAPGFRMGNVYVLAGFPEIMKVMFEAAKGELKKSPPKFKANITAEISEGEIAEDLFTIQDDYPEVEIGSYPFINEGKFCVNLVMTSDDKKKLVEVEEILERICQDLSSKNNGL